MKIFIHKYIYPSCGNYSTEQIDISSNKILVKDLKKIIYEKLQIPINEQKLTIKLSNIMIVTMTDDFPLKFFYIRKDSEIFVEHYHPISKSQEICNKLINKPNTKSKYLSSLGLFNNQYSNNKNNKINNLGIIFESPNEYTEEIFNKNKNNQTINIKEIQNLIITSIKANNLIQFNELREIFNTFKSNFDLLTNEKNGWTALHYSSYYGCSEITRTILKEYKPNVNCLDKEGFTPIHLAIYKVHVDIVRILLSVEGIDINIREKKIGSAIHIACKKNNIKIVSMLLASKADLFEKGEDGFLPVDMTTDTNIKKLLRKVMDKKNSDKSLNIHLNNNEPNHNFYSIIERDFTPPKPEKTLGNVEKIGEYLPIYRYRFLELDPILGYLKRFKSVQDFPTNPKITIPLIDIQSCKREFESNSNQDYYYFSIIYNKKEIYRVKNLNACEKWIEVINKSVIYSKFWHKIIHKNPEYAEYLLKEKNDINIINNETGECKLYIPLKEKRKLTHNINKKIKNSNNINNMKLIDDSSEKGITFNSFLIVDLLGSGTFGKVYKVQLKNSNDQNFYAMKVINIKFLINNHQLRYAITECNVLKLATSPFIVKLNYSFKTKDNLYMILDYCPGGDLSYHLMLNLFEEHEAKFYIAELILAIEHLHKKDIIYRDLKPENILIASDNHIKLADFGLAKEGINDHELTKSFCGSPAYLSPEMLSRRGVGKSADIYGIGAVLYEMISGSPPFYANDIGTLYNNIRRAKLMMQDYFSDELKDLLSKLLCRDPNKRFGIYDKAEIKRHKFFNGIDWEKLERKEIKPPLNLVKIKIENEKRNLNDSVTLVRKDES
jgi:ankyrin repeat protein